jgi:hypothetical protein
MLVAPLLYVGQSSVSLNRSVMNMRKGQTDPDPTDGLIGAVRLNS